MENIDYQTKIFEKEKEFESLCKRCGACCGAFDGDPCIHLVKEKSGTYYCNIYENRLGPQLTVKGNIFTCIPIREVKKDGYLKPNCSYR